ncbi:T9SS type A sorting domain-containing protein [Parasegetibacter sp. NRK P23]|uniref:T9SS type A sorting domain-containing protein n=1 Tax=Parasegetibacter sp. NRK P23 TaxID=2942999 RepID=UPI002043A274|nr:T9SS type A sorting domain-containing protein [Parasegetibacter sp. NRK P23]MCM5529102.1 T9SS type A sorting domain-containing protein [Parasegetibacter sp. NRK P23]
MTNQKLPLTIFLLFVSLFSFSNTITISSSASSGSGWSYSSGVITASADVTINNATINGYLTSGDLTIEAGTNIILSGDINPALGVGITRTLTLKSGNNIVTEATYTISCSSGSLNMVFWSDTDNSNGGHIYFKSTSTLNSKGGHIWMGGGGGSTTWNGLTVGNGYATGSSVAAIPSAELNSGANAAGFRNGITCYNNNILSEGGNIALYGQGAALSTSYGYMGLFMGYNAVISSATGNITINAQTSGASSAIAVGWFYGILMIPTNNTNTLYGTASIESTSGSITINASAAQNQNSNHNAGIALFTQNATAVARIMSNSGDIDVTGSTFNTTNPSYGGIFLTGGGSEQIISRTGNITLRGNSTQTTAPGIAMNTVSRIGYDGVNTYSGNIRIISDKISLSNIGAVFQSTGNLLIEPATSTQTISIATTGGLELPALLFSNNFANGFNDIHIGTSTGSGNITIGSVTFRDNMSFETNGFVIQTGAITASSEKITLLGATGSAALTNSANNIQTLAANTGAIHVVNNAALTLENIQAAGGIQIETLTGNLTITDDISSDNAGATAIRLYADANKTAGDPSGGNIIVSGSPVVTTGAGGRASFYTGSVAGSTGLLALVGGTSNARENVDAFTATITPALGTGMYALYREAGALPVQLVNFRTQCVEGTTVLLWATTSETANSGFYVEKSTDLQNWKTLGFVKGKGTANSLTAYQYTDASPTPSTAYYRLKQTDHSGKQSLSDVLHSRCNASENTILSQVSIYPNPVSSNLQVKGLPANHTVNYALFNAQGVQLKNGTFLSETPVINMGGFTPGIYLLKITTGGAEQLLRIVKQ